MGLTERSFLERMELMGLTATKPITNADRIRGMADRIRGMTDEELAEWLVHLDEKCFHSGHLSVHGYITWLKQEVQE